MNQIEIVLCGNAETIGLVKDNFECLGMRKIEGDGKTPTVWEGSFQFWNGGPGYKVGGGYAVVRLAGYGCVRDVAEARKGVALLLSEKDESWPSSEEVESAFEARDEVAERFDEEIERVKVELAAAEAELRREIENGDSARGE